MKVVLGLNLTEHDGDLQQGSASDEGEGNNSWS